MTTHPQIEVINALFSADKDVEVNLVIDAAPYVLKPDTAIPDGDAILISPLTDKGYAFLWREFSASAIGPIEPTLVLTKGPTSIALYALENIIEAQTALQAMEALGMPTEGNDIPMAGTNGWHIAKFNPDEFTTPEKIIQSFFSDAIICSPLDDEAFNAKITVTVGAGAQAKNWRPREMQVGHLMGVFAKHAVGPKDGRSVVLADMVPGERRKNSVKSLTGIGLDIDTGMPTAEIDAALKKFGYLAIRATTHSFGKTETEVKKDTLQQFIVKHAPGKDPEATETLRWYFKEAQAWNAMLIETVEYVRTDHTKNGIVVVAGHAPIHKNRIIVPLLNPYEIAKEGKTQKDAMDRWAKIPEALARELNVPFDRSCTDPSRLFYLPRHAKGRPYNISLFGGPLFDYKVLKLDSDFQKIAAAVDDNTSGKSKSQTEEGRALGRWFLKRGHGFQIADIIEDCCNDRIRSNASSGYNIECPFDELHSNAGETSDQACFVVNGGDAGTNAFVIKCQHESCKGFTGNDFLGKMLKDNWFEKELLEDDRYNAIIDEKVAESHPEAVKIEKQDQAKKGLEELIEALTDTSEDPEVDPIIRLVVEADTKGMGLERVQKAIAKKTGISILAVRKRFAVVKKVLAMEEVDKTKAENNAKGKHVFTYNGFYNFDDAMAACVKALLARNKKDGVPTFCSVGRSAARLQQFPDAKGFIKVEVEEYGRDSRFWSDLCAVISFQPISDNGKGNEEKVPEDVARHVQDQAHHWLPPAPEVLYTPVFLSDGTRMEKHGYHFDQKREINILLICNDLEMDPIKDNPSREEALEAMEWIRLELLSDFPFWDVDVNGNEKREISEWNAVAMLLTPFVRRMVAGRTPVFFIDKPMAGTGGTLLGQMPMRLFDGKAGDVTTYSQSEDEMLKTLLTAVRENRSHLFFDDVEQFNNRVLLRALTQDNISGRLLGGNKHLSIPNNFNWIGTGNNTVIYQEMRRRCVYIRLNANLANLTKRTFRHAAISGMDYTKFVLTQRGLIIGKIMTVVQYWVSIGKPEYTGDRIISSFEAWCRVVGGILTALDAKDFFKSGDFDREVDSDEAAIKHFVGQFYKRYGSSHAVTQGDLFDWAMTAKYDIISGNTDDQKRSRFINRSLQLMNNRSFEFDGKTLRFARSVSDELGVMYSLIKKPTPVAAAG